MNKFISWMLIILACFTGCGVIRDTPKYQFADGYYHAKLFGQESKRVYINNEEESIYVYQLIKTAEGYAIDTFSQSFPKAKSDDLFSSHLFRQTSFDIDFLTIPFKYRPSLENFPRQFNTNLNGAVYMGFRNDIYQLGYEANLIRKFTRQINHYGFSLGVFTGIGGTTINPWVTNNQVSAEYDGIVWSKGLAGIIGINNFTIGLAFGWDDLLDANKKYWFYQRKPWLGLAFGLNLN